MYILIFCKRCFLDIYCCPVSQFCSTLCFCGGWDGKESDCNAGDPGSIPGLGIFPGGGNGNPLQYTCLENPMDGGAWQSTIHGVAKSQTRLHYYTTWDPMDCSTPGFPVHHHLPELAQTHFHWVGDAIQPSYSLLSPSRPAFNLSQHQAVFQWVSCLHEVTKVMELQHQH